MTVGPGLVVAAVVALGAAVAPAVAAPVVSVKGRPAIELEPVRRTGGGIEVRGRVTELAGGEPLPFVVLDIAIDGEAEPTQADADGNFRHFYPLDRGVHRLSVEVRGDRQLAPARALLESFDIEKRPLKLAVSARELDGGEPGVRVMVSATGLRSGDDDDAAAITAEVRAGPLDGPAVPIGDVTTDGDGFGELVVPLATLGGAGRRLVEVVYRGDEVWDAAQGQTVVLVRTATALSLELGPATVRHEGRLTGTGRLVDAGGAGLAAQPIVLLGRGRTLADLVSDERGGFAFSIAASELGPGPLSVQAAFDSPAAWLESSRSPIVDATIEERRPVPVGLTLGAFAATALAIAAFVALRTRPWERWLAGRRGAPAAGPTAPRADAPPPEGLSLARPGLVSTLRRAHDHGFAGTIRSAPTGRPIPGATVRVALPGGDLREAVGDQHGDFAVEDLPPGTLAAVVSAGGHVTVRFELAVPHRGELRGARVDLVEVRERIFSMYRTVAEPLLPSADRWGVWTPRQIVDAVRATRPAPALATLTDYVEEKYFSQRTPDEDELAEAGRQIAAAAGEQAA
jgi:hypothetical protein